MSAQKIIDGLNDALAGNITRERLVVVNQSPEEVIAKLLVHPLPFGEKGYAAALRESRKKANKITRALRDSGWRILR